MRSARRPPRGKPSPRPAGLPRYRGRQIFDALHRRGRFDFAAMRELPARAPRGARRGDADPAARGRAARGVRRRQREVRPAARRRRPDRGRLHAGRGAHGPVNEFSDARAPAGLSTPRPSTRRPSTPPVVALHRLPLLPDRVRGRLRFLRDRPSRRRAQPHGGRDPGPAPRRSARNRTLHGRDADRLHGHGRAVSQSRGRAPRARGPLRARVAAPRDRLDVGRDAGLSAVRRAFETSQPRRIAQRRRSGDARAADADHEDLSAGGGCSPPCAPGPSSRGARSWSSTSSSPPSTTPRATRGSSPGFCEGFPSRSTSSR